MNSKLVVLFLPLLAVAKPLPQDGSQDGSGLVPDPTQITVLGTNYSGNGCPQDSVTADLNPARTLITFGFDKFQTYIGPSVSIEENSKNCQLHLNLQYPGGFQYSLVRSTYHGWAQMDQGVSGVFTTSYFFSQDPGNTASSAISINGTDGNTVNGQEYTRDSELTTASLVWSPCGDTGLLNLNNRITLHSTSRTASGSLTDDDATISFKQEVLLQWQACTPTETRKRNTEHYPPSTFFWGPESSDSITLD